VIYQTVPNLEYLWSFEVKIELVVLVVVTAVT